MCRPTQKPQLKLQRVVGSIWAKVTAMKRLSRGRDCTARLADASH
jgi:hypothetical protein